MGLRYTTRLYKPTEKNIDAVVLTAAQKLGVYARPSDDSTDMKLLRIGERWGRFHGGTSIL